MTPGLFSVTSFDGTVGICSVSTFVGPPSEDQYTEYGQNALPGGMLLQNALTGMHRHSLCYPVVATKVRVDAGFKLMYSSYFTRTIKTSSSVAETTSGSIFWFWRKTGQLLSKVHQG